MSGDQLETILRLLFQGPLTRFGLTDLNTKGILTALRTIYSPAELVRIQFVLKSLPSQNRRPIEEELLRNYQREVMDLLKQEHLFLARHKELQIIRRPEILETYNYLGELYIAVSERVFLTARSGEIQLVELADFQYLPRPLRNASVALVLKKWGLTSEQFDKVLSTYYHNIPHQEQRDIFHTDLFVLLKYNRDGKFVEALPPAGAIPTIQLLKGRSGAERESPPDEDLADEPEDLLPSDPLPDPFAGV